MPNWQFTVSSGTLPTTRPIHVEYASNKMQFNIKFFPRFIEEKSFNLIRRKNRSTDFYYICCNTRANIQIFGCLFVENVIFLLPHQIVKLLIGWNWNEWQYILRVFSASLSAFIFQHVHKLFGDLILSHWNIFTALARGLSANCAQYGRIDWWRHFLCLNICYLSDGHTTHPYWRLMVIRVILNIAEFI